MIELLHTFNTGWHEPEESVKRQNNMIYLQYLQLNKNRALHTRQREQTKFKLSASLSEYVNSVGVLTS